MEKNKNRTDLLAAGRKKLQQYRQKKDNKGNNSKSSIKAGKSGGDTTGSTVTEAAVTQQHAADGEISRHGAEDTIAFSESSSIVDSVVTDAAAGKSGDHTMVGPATEAAEAQQHAAGGDRSKHDAEDIIDLSESSSRVDSMLSDSASNAGHDTTAGTATEAEATQHHAADGERYKHDADEAIALPESGPRADSVVSDIAAATDELSAKAAIEMASLAGTAEFPLQSSEIDGTWSSQSAGDGRDVDSGVAQEGGSSSLVLVGAMNNEPAMILKEEMADSSISFPIDFSSGLETEHGEEQVTDVGAMQKVDSSSGYQIDKGMVSRFEGDGSPPLNDSGETTEEIKITDSGNTMVEEEIHVALQLSKTSDASLTGAVTIDAGEGQERHGYSVVTGPSTDSRLVSTISSGVAGQQRDGTSSASDEEKAEMHNLSVANAGSHTEGTQSSSGFFDVERFSESETNDNTKSLACKQVNLSSILEGSVIKLSQLAEILRVLDEDEFRFVVMSRELSVDKFRDTDNIQAHDYAVRDAFERLKEHLYVTSLSKDAFHLQLSEHQIEVQGKNEIFAEEILQSRRELQEAVTEREEIQKQLQLSKAEVEVFDAKVDELQNKLEMAQGELSSVSSELVDCRKLVKALQAENENLNESFKVMTEEKNKLTQENGNLLLENEKMTGELAQSKASFESLQTLLRDVRKQLDEENEAMVRENNKLLDDLAEYKSKVEALEYENRNLNGILTSVSNGRKKLEEEKAFAAHQTEEMSKEVIDSKDLVVTLQAEISNLKKHLTSMTEERIKLEEEKNQIFSEYEKQSRALVEIQVLQAGVQAECSKAVDDLKEAKTSVNQLSEENKTLNADLEFHKFKVSELHPEKYSSQFEEVASRGVENDICALQKPKFEWLSLEQRKLDAHDDSSGFVALKKKLEDTEIVMQKLEEEIEGMHLHSTSLSRSTDKVVAPGVSRLIQAFEPKGHSDDQDPEEPPPSEVQTNEDLYMSTKMVAHNLKVLLNELVDDADKASQFCRVMQGKLLADAAGRYRSKYDSLREHTDEVEEANIELMVLYEAMKENTCYVVAKEGELLDLCDALRKQEVALKLENSHLGEKLNDFQSQISELQNLLDGFCRGSDEKVASVSNQLQTLQADLADREAILEEEWNSVSAQILQTVGVLDSTISNFFGNSFAGGNGNLDVVGCVAASVGGACKVIEGLHGQLEAAHRDCQEKSDKTDLALGVLHKLYSELSELVRRSFGYYPDEAENFVVDDKVLHLLRPDVFDNLLDHLKRLSSERLEAESENKQLSSELMSRARETDKLKQNCLKADTILKLIQEIEQSVRLEGTLKNAAEPASVLESLIHLLVQKYTEAEQGGSLSASLELHLSDLQAQVEHLNLVLLQYENENLVFKHSLKSAEEDIIALNSRVREKVAELEQSEQRVSTVREKLSLAVTRGKGLLSQRDSLKQSLAETSRELEKCSQELLSKDARLHELDTKLRVYSEAGERMEALESELSYIRNSATALRESFLLKDSVLQRIEEILEDLELSEHFHSKDTIEKIDWLAKSVGGNSLPLGDWDQRSAVGETSYSDPGFVGMDGLKEDTQQNPNSSDELRRRHEELQNKFYGLAEQNEMLEQSLMERNNLVRQLEEILDKVDMPSHLRSMEPENKIKWFESALLEAQNLCYSLQQKIDNLETFCASLNADMEDSQRRNSELEASFHQACVEKEIMSRNLELLRDYNDESSTRIADFEVRNENLQNEVSMMHERIADFEVRNEKLQNEASILQERIADFEVRNEKLQNEASMLQEQKLRMEEDIHHTQDAIRRLQELVNDALQESCTEDVVLGQEAVEHFEEMFMKLIQKYKTLLSGKPVNIDSIDADGNDNGNISRASTDIEVQDVVTLSKKLEDYMGEIMSLKEEKDRYMLSNQSLLGQVEELEIKKKELEELLNQEEHRSASLRDKLSLAVRRGKSLVQQRDGMKQVIEELNAEVERLKHETELTKKAIYEYEEQINNLFADHERVQFVESENTFLRDRLAETERTLQEKEESWSTILDALGEFDLGLAFKSGNPIEKLKEIGKYLHDLRSGMDSLEQESRKSKRAAELLLAELNEVQERNDGLQDDLAKASHELSEVYREKDLAENAKYEALAHVEKLSYIHAEEKDKHLSEIMVLKSGVDNMRDDISAIEREVDNVLSQDLQVLYNMKAAMKSFMEIGGPPSLSAPFPGGGFHGGVMSTKSENKDFMIKVGSLRERFHNHLRALQEETSQLSEVVMNVHREYTSQKELCESVNREVKQLKSIEKEKESELHVLQGNISGLYESCASAILKIKNWKDRVVGNALASRAPERKFKSQIQIEGGNSLTNDTNIFNEESIRSMCDELLLVVGDLISMHNEMMEVGQGEMKSTILNLQKELQEKDIQRERICMELVNQIKGAETNAKNYLHDLQQARVQLHDSQRQLDVMAEEHKVWEQRMKELQDQESNSLVLQQKVNSLTDALAAKVQESEALLQALDEEEAEMENLANKIVGLENELQQKNKDLENLEASRAKAFKKLSVTVSKFDELHHLSENLLSEVEKLQSQLQERDGEISFLRQEITRCTNDALAVTQMNKQRNSDEIKDLLSWFDSSISRLQLRDVTSGDSRSHLVNEDRDILQKKILDLISELENLHVLAQNRDMLLQEERSKVGDLTQKEQHLRNSLRETESQLIMLQGAEGSAKATESTSEIVEVEQMTNKWVPPPVTIAPQVRSLRKTNNDQVAIAIDTDQSGERLEDDDDKAHGFKSLTTSRIVPRFTRPVSDMVDGLWVSCDRALMRQPAVRLGLIIYWVVLHAMVATFVV